VSKPDDRPTPPLGASLERNPQLDTWVAVHSDGTVTVRTGKAELGQGLKTAIARICADELDIAVERVRVETADTASGPMEFMTVGSMSMEDSGTAVRQVCAEARQHMLERAAAKLGAPLAALEVDDGEIRVAGTARTNYWKVQGGRRFDRVVTGEARPKQPDQYKLIGKFGARIDLPAKLTGGAFLHDQQPAGLVHGRVMRPPSYAATLVEADFQSARAMPGVIEVVHDGRFVAVVAEREEQAIAAHDRLALSARWNETETLPDEARLAEFLVDAPQRAFPVIDGTAVEAPVEPWRPPAHAALQHTATYTKPFYMHGSIGPAAALAHLDGDQLTVWSHSQGVAILRLALAQALDRDRKTIRVIHAEGAGAYGHNGADDAALDAALLALVVPGRPVRVQWTRVDEHTWEPYNPAARVDMEAALDGSGNVLAWSHEVRSNTHMGRPFPTAPGTSNFIADWHRADAKQPIPAEPRLEHHAGIHRNAEPYYRFANTRIVKHFVEDAPLRVSSMRGLGAFANVFAIESFVDELAHAAGADPVEWRLRHLDDERARDVVRAAAERAGWSGRPEPGTGSGMGIAFARYKNVKTYAAVVVELDVDAASGAIRLRRATIASDAGQVIDPDGLANQLEGGFVQAASWTLKEVVRFDRTRIRSRDWDSYPILGFDEVPDVDTILLDRPGAPVLGAGEATQGPTPAAIANALFHACGLRCRDLPLTPERVRAALG